MLTAKQNVHKRVGRTVSHPVAANTKIHGGALVVLENGFARPGRSALGLMAIGMAIVTADNSAGADSDVLATMERDDWFRLRNDVGDPVTRSSINQPCYIVDDETVAASDGANTRSIAGTVRDIDDVGVWISFD